MADKKQSAEDFAGHIAAMSFNALNDIFSGDRITDDEAVRIVDAIGDVAEKYLKKFAIQERAEQKQTDAETVRGIKQMRVHEMFRGLDNPFLDAKSEPDKDGWTNLSKSVLKILARAATAIVKGAK